MSDIIPPNRHPVDIGLGSLARLRLVRSSCRAPELSFPRRLMFARKSREVRRSRKLGIRQFPHSEKRTSRDLDPRNVGLGCSIHCRSRLRQDRFPAAFGVPAKATCVVGAWRCRGTLRSASGEVSGVSSGVDWVILALGLGISARWQRCGGPAFRR